MKNVDKGGKHVKKGFLEFINACAWCDVYTSFVEGLAKEYSDRLNVKIYKVGKDFDYLRKYGPVMKSVLVINERKKIDNISKETIRKAFEEAIIWFMNL